MKFPLFKHACLLVIALLAVAVDISAQTDRAVAKPEKAPEAARALDPVIRCEACKYAVPAEVYTSTQDAVVFYGPPDGKGAPVEYQVFTQKTTGAAWVFAARGDIIKPGEKHAYCFPNTAQILVFVWCATPFASSAEFSDTCK